MKAQLERGVLHPKSLTNNVLKSAFRSAATSSPVLPLAVVESE